MPDILTMDPQTLARWAAPAVGLLLAAALWIVVRKLWSRAKPAAPPDDLVIDVASLPATGPDPRMPRLDCHQIPVRLAVVVLAPLGRDEPLPLNVDVSELVEQIVPGLGRVAETHGPIVYRWPAQLSWPGFANTFFTHLQLPGERGKGTPWAAVCGRFDRRGKKCLAGLALCAASANGLGCFRLESEGQWLETLRVRAPADGA